MIVSAFISIKIPTYPYESILIEVLMFSYLSGSRIAPDSISFLNSLVRSVLVPSGKYSYTLICPFSVTMSILPPNFGDTVMVMGANVGVLALIGAVACTSDLVLVSQKTGETA